MGQDDRKGSKAMLVAGMLAVGTVVGLAIGAWVFVMGSKEVGQDSQERANQAASREPAYAVQTAHLAWQGDALVLHVVAGPEARSTSVLLSEMPLHMEGLLEPPDWRAFRDADGSLDQDPPLLNGGDLVEFTAKVDADALPDRPDLSFGQESHATLRVPAHIGSGITSLRVLG